MDTYCNTRRDLWLEALLISIGSNYEETYAPTVRLDALTIITMSIQVKIGISLTHSFSVDC